MKTDHQPLVNRLFSSSLASSLRQQICLNYIAQLTKKVAYVSGEENVTDITVFQGPRRHPVSAPY